MKTNTRWTRSIATVVLVLAVAVLFAACGGGDNGGADATSTEASADEHADDDDHAADDHDADAGENASAYLEAAPKDQLYVVEMTNFAFTPAALDAVAGEVLEIAIQNVEVLLHDFTIDDIDADVHVSYLGGTGQHAHEESQLDADVHFALTEPGSGVVHMKINEPGEYVFYCSVPGHREAGMEGTLIVR